MVASFGKITLSGSRSQNDECHPWPKSCLETCLRFLNRPPGAPPAGGARVVSWQSNRAPILVWNPYSSATFRPPAPKCAENVERPVLRRPLALATLRFQLEGANTSLGPTCTTESNDLPEMDLFVPRIFQMHLPIAMRLVGGKKEAGARVVGNRLPTAARFFSCTNSKKGDESLHACKI